VQALLSLYQQLPIMHERPFDWLSMRQATRQLGPSGLSVVALIRMVQAGRIDARRLRQHDDFKPGLFTSGVDDGWNDCVIFCV
jgi:hypothetical protein